MVAPAAETYRSAGEGRLQGAQAGNGHGDASGDGDDGVESRARPPHQCRTRCALGACSFRKLAVAEHVQPYSLLGAAMILCHE